MYLPFTKNYEYYYYDYLPKVYLNNKKRLCQVYKNKKRYKLDNLNDE